MSSLTLGVLSLFWSLLTLTIVYLSHLILMDKLVPLGNSFRLPRRSFLQLNLDSKPQMSKMFQCPPASEMTGLVATRSAPGITHSTANYAPALLLLHLLDLNLHRTATSTQDLMINKVNQFFRDKMTLHCHRLSPTTLLVNLRKGPKNLAISHQW